MKIFSKKNLILNENIYKKKHLALRESEAGAELGGSNRVSGGDVTLDKTGNVQKNTIHKDVLVPNTATGEQAANAAKNAIKTATRNGEIPQQAQAIDANIVPVDTTKLPQAQQQQIRNNMNNIQVYEGLTFSKKEMNKFLKDL